MPATPNEGWTRYLTPSVALFEYVDDDELLPIRPIGIQVNLRICICTRILMSTRTGALFRPLNASGCCCPC